MYVHNIAENPQNIMMIPTMLITMMTMENVNFSFAFKLMGKNVSVSWLLARTVNRKVKITTG